jgi:hypothetical protein
MGNDPRFALLAEHFDLLPSPKREIARWIVSRAPDSKERLPQALHRHAFSVFSFNLKGPDAIERLRRALILELLSKHRAAILRRRRVGATSNVPLGPRRVSKTRGC